MKKASEVDILELPLIRNVVGAFRGRSRRGITLVFANTAVRREAKALLFAELAEAVRQKMPLDLALSLSFQTVGEERSTPPEVPASGAATRNAWQSVIGIMLYFTAVIGDIAYAVLAFRGFDVERVARFLAMRLHRHVSAGLALSQAMRRCSIDFDSREIAVVESGERYDTMASALKRLSEFQVTESRLTMQGAQAIYPLLVGAMFLGIAAFFNLALMPKYQKMFDQLGADFPGLTVLVFGSAPALKDLLVGLFAPVAAIVVGFLVLRTLMNGSITSIVFVLLPMILIPAWSIISMGVHPATDSDSSLSQFVYWTMGRRAENISWLPVVTLPLGIVIAVVWAFASVALLYAIEWIILWIERHLGELLRFIPVVGATQRTESEARWLAALSVALESRLPVPDALVMAGEICGGALRARSRAAAQSAAAGTSIGDACVRARVLRPAINHQLVLVDWQGEFVTGLRAISEDAAQQAFDELNRTGRIAEVFATVVVTVAAFVVLLAIYLPLFAIPRIVMHMGGG